MRWFDDLDSKINGGIYRASGGSSPDPNATLFNTGVAPSPNVVLRSNPAAIRDAADSAAMDSRHQGPQNGFQYGPQNGFQYGPQNGFQYGPPVDTDARHMGTGDYRPAIGATMPPAPNMRAVMPDGTILNGYSAPQQPQRQTIPAIVHGGNVPATAATPMPASVRDIGVPDWMTSAPRELVVPHNFSTAAYGRQGSGVNANDYSLSLGQGPRQRVREFNQQRNYEAARSLGQFNEEEARRIALAGSFMHHVISPFLTGTADVAKYGEQAAGKEAAARETALGQMGTQKLKNKGAMEQLQYGENLQKANPGVFSQVGNIHMQAPLKPVGLKEGENLYNPTTGATIASNPKPAEAAKPVVESKITPLTHTENGKKMIHGYHDSKTGKVTPLTVAVPFDEPAATTAPAAANKNPTQGMKPEEIRGKIRAANPNADDASLKELFDKYGV